MADLLQTVDLTQSTPVGWTLAGFSAPRSDGVNPYRVVEKSTQISFSTSEPQYVRFQLQLYSPTQKVTATVKLDGQSLGEYHFGAGKFETVYPSGFVKAGVHHLEVEQSCVASCEIHQYHTQIQFYSVELNHELVGYNAQRWRLNTPEISLKLDGFSNIKFDGNNFYRPILGIQPASIIIPTALNTRLTNLHYLTQSDHGDYQLYWTVNGHIVHVRNDLDGHTKMTDWTPAGQNADQNIALVGAEYAQTLQVHAQCKGGGTVCFPIRMYWIEVTGVPREVGLSHLGLPKQVLSVGLCLLLCLLVTWFLRPWQRSGV